MACVWIAVGGPTAVAGDHYNIVLISIDALRADRLNCYGFSKHSVSTLKAVDIEAEIVGR